VKPIRLLAILQAARAVTGPGRNLLDFARLARLGDPPVETTVAVFRKPGDSTAFLDAASQADVPAVSVTPWDRRDRRSLRELRELARRLEPDIVQTHAILPHFLARAAKLHRQAPWVAFHHGYTWPDLRTRVLLNPLDRWSLRAAARIITTCSAFREDLARRGLPRERISVVYNAIPSDWGARCREEAGALRARLGIGAEEKVILAVGRLSSEKGHLLLIDALAGLHRAGVSHARLVLVGEGPERPRLEARVRARGLAKAVTLLGRAAAEPFYGIADALALPSRSEGCSNVLLEAMTTGVPIAATAAGGVPETVTDRETALLAPPGDAPAMTAALRELLLDSVLARALAQRAREAARSRFTVEGRVAELTGIYAAIRP
jgi:glycosyltransferase involved in cell wall biosynthesis